MDTSSKKPAGALIAASDNHLIVLSSEAVRAVSELECSLAQPFAQPWVAGMTFDASGRLLTVIAPFGVSDSTEPRRIRTLVLMADWCGPWAVLVDTVAAGAGYEPLPDQGRLSAVCPVSWLKPVRLADGRSAVRLEINAVANAFAAGAAA
jgi:hypothetical protein